jgi:hypothetical protein
MNLKKMLSSLVSVITEEAEKNDQFRANVERALGIDVSPNAQQAPGVGNAKRKGGRRPVAVLDPVELARQGEETLRVRISTLTLDQLRDIVAEHGMDPGKLVMKWKDTDRVRDRIVEVALARATKGDAFRAE